MAQCIGINKDGSHCRKHSSNGSKYCRFHDSSKKASVVRNARKAGKTKRKMLHDPFQDLITLMVRKALVDILTGGK